MLFNQLKEDFRWSDVLALGIQELNRSPGTTPETVAVYFEEYLNDEPTNDPAVCSETALELEACLKDYLRRKQS